MKTLLLAIVLASSGCSAALVERLSTDTYWSHTKAQEGEVHVSEHPIGIRDHFGYNKRLIVHNPLSYPIEAHISCSSIYQDDPTVHVKAHAVRYLLITGMRELDQTCFLMDYEAALQ
jgi:hypothetical protein